MAHEIYYTSAPEGVKPGQQGFCTVATSPGIPRPLWDRLESISGYRHQFGGADAGRNPVAWAHWLLQVGGREVSVLSRVADAGLDYTQRTNYFAHHLALEPDERAAAGPGWMLAQPGLTAPAWDGRVGDLARRAALPRGDASPRPCAAWQHLAGDAGWAGVLAETATRNARRPVCLLFAPGQDLLPLVAEAVALLPPGQRWQVTFNTYFTSLPGNAACAWRCCLAGTPAASEALRHAAGWLVLDLTQPGRLGAPPAGPWVDLARTGRGTVGAGAAAGAMKGAASARAPAKPARRQPPPLPGGGTPYDVAGDSDDTDEATRAALAALAEPPAAAAVDVLAPATRPRPWGGILQRGAKEPAPKREPAARPAGESRVLDTTWTELRRRARRRWTIGLTAVAAAFVGAGVYLQVQAYRSSSSRPLPPPPPATLPAIQLTSDDPLPTPTTRSVLPPLPTTTEAPPPPPPSVVIVEPTTRQAPAPVVVRPPPKPIVLPAPLQQPVPAVAGRDPVQTIVIPASDVEDLRAVAVFDLRLPPDRQGYAAREAEMNGTLFAAPAPRSPLRHVLTWRDAANPARPVEVATVSFDPARPKLEVTWRVATVLQRPGVTALARAVLQHAKLSVADARRARPQPVHFPPPVVAVDVAADRSAPAARVDLPPGVRFVAGGAVPDGWQVSGGPDAPPPAAAAGGPNAAGAAGAAAAPAVGSTGGPQGWALRFARPASSDQPAGEFVVRIAPAWRSVQSTLAAQQQAARAGQARAEQEVAKWEGDLAAGRRNMEAELEPWRRQLAEAESQVGLSDDELRGRLTTREDLNRRIKETRDAIAARTARLEQGINGILADRDRAARQAAGWRALAEAYDRFDGAEVAVELPDGLRVVTLRLVRGKK